LKKFETKIRKITAKQTIFAKGFKKTTLGKLRCFAVTFFQKKKNNDASKKHTQQHYSN